ncbi:MAG: TetR/AcrR family transcriptional regulator [Acidimicrobiales bacterium]
MGRRPNPQRREELLSEILEYVEKHGLADLSLRPLANALGTSTYTLTYQFGSKEELLDSILSAIEAREQRAAYHDLKRSVADRIGLLWQHIETPKGLAEQRLAHEALLARVLQRHTHDVYPSPEAVPDELIGDAESAQAAGESDEPLIGDSGVDLTAQDQEDDADVRLLWSAVEGVVIDYLRTGDQRRAMMGMEALRERAARMAEDGPGGQPAPAINLSSVSSGRSEMSRSSQ